MMMMKTCINPLIKAVRSSTIQWRSLASSTVVINSKSNRNSCVGYHYDRISFSNSSKPILHCTAIIFSKVRQYTTISRAICNRSLVKAVREPYHLSDSSMNRSSLLVSRRSMTSVIKKRRTKMNKHKLRKRRKLMKLNTKISRE